MHRLLSASGKYSQGILLFDKNTSQVNVELASFIRKHQSTNIDEIFFYFTGHGERDTDFHYLLVDFEDERLNSTSLSNESLDQMLRSLGAEIVVKVIDACYSSQRYVKDKQGFQEIFEKSKNEYQKAYFMFSSSENQTSKASSDLSFFTRSFLNSVPLESERDLLFREVSASIADDSFLKRYQSPHFVTQANHTEVFLTVNTQVIRMLKDISGELNNRNIKDAEIVEEDNSNLALQEPILLAQLKELEKKYWSKEDAEIGIEHFVSSIENYELSTELTEIYDILVPLEEEFDWVPGVDKVAKWLDSSDQEFFVKISRSTETYKEMARPISIAAMLSSDTPKEVVKTRIVPTSFKPTVDFAYKAIFFLFEPKLESLFPIQIFILFAFSKSSFAIFSKYEKFREITWGERSLENSNSWNIDKANLKDKSDLERISNEIMANLEHEIISDIQDHIEGAMVGYSNEES